MPGVFLGHARVASVGVAVNRWIAYHGLTLNVGPFLEPFELLDEPGLGAVRRSGRPRWSRGGSGPPRWPRSARR